MLSHAAQKARISGCYRVIYIRLRDLHRHGEKERKVHGAHCPQKIRKYDIGVLQVIAIQYRMVKILSHQKLIDGYGVIPEEIKHRIPLHLMVQHQASQRMIFFQIQPLLASFIDGAPVRVLHVKLMDLCHILRQLIGEFSAHTPVCYDRKQNKFVLRKRLDHAVNPPGYAADHIRIASLCYDTDLHHRTSSLVILDSRVLSLV